MQQRFLILAATVLFVSASVVQAEEVCGPEGSGSEPMNSTIEARYVRYLRQNSHPRTFRNDEEKTRWEWLNEKNKCEQENRRNRHLGQRSTGIADRLRIRRISSEVEQILPAFDPDGPGSERLAQSNREARIQRYAVSGNCQSNAFTEDEKIRCDFLVSQRRYLTQQSTDRRRLSTSATRVSDTNLVDIRRRRVRSDYAEVTVGSSYRASTGAAAAVEVNFDPNGPGSSPLDRGVETRLRRYVDNEKCPVTIQAEVTERCRWLISQKRFYQVEQQTRTRKRLQSRGLGDVRLSRGVGTAQQSVLRVQNIGGGRPAVRTIQGVEERFGIQRGTGRRWRINVVPGDCQIDAKLCND